MRISLKEKNILDSYGLVIYENDNDYELENYTSCGVNMFITIDKEKNDNLKEQLNEIINNFDIDEEIDIHRENDEYRDNFTIRESLEDFEEWLDIIKNVVNELEQSETKTDNSFITLKFGIVKGYNFSNNFIDKNKEIFNNFVDIYNDIYNNTCSVSGASNLNKNNIDLKNRLYDILDKMFDLGVEIYNGFTDELYQNKKDIKNYIIEY